MAVISLCIFFSSCKKDNSQLIEVQKANPTFRAVESVDPAILKLMHDDFIKEGDIKRAEGLSDKYDFKTGKLKLDQPESLVFPTASVSGVGTVITGVTFTETFGPSTSYRAGTGITNTISFNAMNSATALQAFNNTTPPAGTFLASPSTISGVQFPVIKLDATDVTSTVYSTPNIVIQYTATTAGGTSYTQTAGNLAGTVSGCGSSNCWLTGLSMGFSSNPFNTNLYDNTGTITSTAVSVKLYYRVSTTVLGVFSFAWANWVSANTNAGVGRPINDIQVRAYIVL